MASDLATEQRLGGNEKFYLTSNGRRSSTLRTLRVCFAKYQAIVPSSRSIAYAPRMTNHRAAKGTTPEDRSGSDNEPPDQKMAKPHAARRQAIAKSFLAAINFLSSRDDG
jgi:hypothetical protein